MRNMLWTFRFNVAKFWVGLEYIQLKNRMSTFLHQELEEKFFGVGTDEFSPIKINCCNNI